MKYKVGNSDPQYGDEDIRYFEDKGDAYIYQENLKTKLFWKEFEYWLTCRPEGAYFADLVWSANDLNKCIYLEEVE